MAPEVGSWWWTRYECWPSKADRPKGFDHVFHEVLFVDDEHVGLIQSGADRPYFVEADRFDKERLKPFNPPGTTPNWVQPGAKFRRPRGKDWTVTTVRGAFFTAELGTDTFRFFSPLEFWNLRPHLTWHQRVLATR